MTNETPTVLGDEIWSEFDFGMAAVHFQLKFHKTAVIIPNLSLVNLLYT